MSEAVFSQVVRLHLRPYEPLPTALHRIGREKGHLGPAHRLSTFVGYPAIDNGFPMQAKDQVLGVLVLSGGNANEEPTVLLEPLMQVAWRRGTQDIFPRRQPIEGKAPVITGDGIGLFAPERNRHLRTRYWGVRDVIHDHATDAICGLRPSLWLRLRLPER